MAELTFADYRDRLSMEDVLQDAGYEYYRKDGIRHRSYVRYDSAGSRVRGDKYIVSPNRKTCFLAGVMKSYSVTSFIMAFPEKFKEYRPGMSSVRLVNEVCSRLLNVPASERKSRETADRHEEVERVPFKMEDYDVLRYDENDKANTKLFYPYFVSRGINFWTQQAFKDNFMLTMKKDASELAEAKKGESAGLNVSADFSDSAMGGRASEEDLPEGKEQAGGVMFSEARMRMRNQVLMDLDEDERITVPTSAAVMKFSHPAGSKANPRWANLSFPMRIPGKDEIVGLEERGRTFSKVNKKPYKGMALGSNASEGLWIANLSGRPLSQVKRVYWFESAYDAMAAYQIRKAASHFDSAYVSTGGTPSKKQIEGMLAAAPWANHYLGFDRDEAGQRFVENFKLIAKEKGLPEERVSVFACQEPFKDWNEQLLDEIAKKKEEKEKGAGVAVEGKDKGQQKAAQASEPSALQKQFRQLKEKRPEVLLLFRTGDFYTAYNEDAQRSAEILGIKVVKPTSETEKGLTAKATFPHYALDTYLPKLVRADVRVAICDPLEASKQTLAQRGNQLQKGEEQGQEEEKTQAESEEKQEEKAGRRWRMWR